MDGCASQGEPARGQIICIGDELITGRVAEANSAYAARRLWELGLGVEAVVIVGDEPRTITRALKRAVAEANFVIVSGGLGATDDDITAQVAAEALGMELAISRQMVANLREFFSSRGRAPAPEDMKMAWLPEGARVLHPECAGFMVMVGDVAVYFVPGVPAEARMLIDEVIVPELAERYGSSAVARALVRVVGMREVEVARRVKGLKLPEEIRIGYYPSLGEVVVSLSALGQRAQEMVQQAEEAVVKALGEYAIGNGGRQLEEVVVETLSARGLTLAVAESCTGGLVAKRITCVPGASACFLMGVVAYSNMAKSELLGVKPLSLERYGAVSRQVAMEMAEGALKAAGADIAVATTGIAGPTGGSPDKPVGTVWLSLAHSCGSVAGLRHFRGSRTQIQHQAATTALDMIRRYLEGYEVIPGS